jgi:hypothetical protein
MWLERQGTVMTRTTFARLFFMAIAGLALAPACAQAACKLQLISSVDVELGAAGAVLLPVKINGHDTWMVLQMSSGISLVNRKVAKQLGMELQEQRKFQSNQGNGRYFPQMSVVGSMLVGTTNFAGWSLYVLAPSDQPVPMFRGLPVLGPLSSQIALAADMELDLAHGKLNLFTQTSACDGGQVYWGGEVATVPLYVDQSGLLVFPVEVDGQSVEASLNTQGRATVMSQKVIKKFFGKDSRQAGGADQGYRRMSLTARGLEMNDVEVRLLDDRKSPCVPTTSDRHSRAIGFDQCISQAPLSIGTDLLRRLRIYIATKEGRIFFTRVGPDPAAAAPNAGD